MTKKEFLVENADSKKQALKNLECQIAFFLFCRKLTPWKWNTPPQAAKDGLGQWKAYAQIEFGQSGS